MEEFEEEDVFSHCTEQSGELPKIVVACVNPSASF